MTNDLISRAKDFAHRAHDSINQTRKYSGEPYWVHTDAVAELVANYGGTPEIVAAAHLHDVLEDVLPALISQGRLADADKFHNEFHAFPASVKAMVFDLTHEYTPEKYPKWNRAKRKQAEAERLGTISDDSKTIKLADFIHNTVSIVENDAEFAKVYLAEKKVALAFLVGGNQELLHRAIVQQGKCVDKLASA